MMHTARAAMPQSPYKKFTIKPYHIKYYGPIFVFFIMIAAIKVFLNYATIQTSIAQVRKETQTIERRTQYEGLQAYMYTRPEASFFIAHDNGVLLEKERIMVNMRLDDIAGSGGQLSGAVAMSGAMLSGADTGTGVLVEHAQALLPPWKSWVQYIAERMD